MSQAKFTRVPLILAALTLTGGAWGQTVRFVTEESYPFQYMENKQLKGMAVEIVSEMSKRAGIKAEHEVMAWKDAYERTQRDRNTCIYSAARLENRERLFKWVGPLVENRWAAFAKKGLKQKPAKLADLRYVRVGVLDGDAKVTYMMDNGIAYALNRVNDDALNPPLLTVDKNEPGKIDVWVTGYYSALTTAAKTNTTDIEHLFTFEKSPNYLACNSYMKDEQVQAMVAALAAMKKDGSHQKVVDKYDPLKK